MKISYLSACILLFGILLATPGVHATGHHAFGFNASDVSGISGRISITGGGAYSLPDFVHSAGGFSCVETVDKGPFATGNNNNLPCQAGEGVRWDTVELLPSVQFKCFAADTPHTATTGDKTVVLKADFYEASDGTHESFSAVPMIVSAVDLRPDLAGNQNVWIAGAGCGSATVSFN